MASCPNCESAVDSTDNFCRTCGTELDTNQERNSYPPESSPMFGGETWTEAGGGRELSPSERGAQTDDNGQPSQPMTFPPESSPMFGGENWTMPTVDDESDTDQAVNTPSSPFGGAQGRDAIRNMLIYSIAAIAIVGAYMYF